MGAGLGAVTTGKVVDDRTVMHIVGGSIPLQSFIVSLITFYKSNMKIQHSKGLRTQLWISRMRISKDVSSSASKNWVQEKFLWQENNA